PNPREHDISAGVTVVRVPPADDAYAVVHDAVVLGDALVLHPSTTSAAALAARLRRDGTAVALLPHDWARAARGGAVIVGSSAAVGRCSTSSTVDRRIRGPRGCTHRDLRSGSGIVVRAGWCACSTAPAGRGCWRAARVGRWRAASGATPRSYKSRPAPSCAS